VRLGRGRLGKGVGGGGSKNHFFSKKKKKPNSAGNCGVLVASTLIEGSVILNYLVEELIIVCAPDVARLMFGI
jgi:hypothetical protein